MQKLLIADMSDAYTDALREIFQHEFDMRICHDGDTALELLQSFQPDVLVINFHLPFVDGLTVLFQSAYKPKMILALTSRVDDYIAHKAELAGVQYLLILPSVESLRVRLMDLVASALPREKDLMGQTAVHLHNLNFHTHLHGYRQLCIGIPIYAENPHIAFSKELYPAIASQLHLPDPRTVEHSIRNAIEDAWKIKKNRVWLKYFPAREDGTIPCPSNKAFFAAIAEKLEMPPCNLSAECYNNREGNICLRSKENTEENHETDQCSR